MFPVYPGRSQEAGDPPRVTPSVSTAPKAKAGVRPSPRPVPGPALEGMGQSVVKAALDSGIDIKHIEEMGRFLKAQGRPTKDEPRPSAKARFAKTTWRTRTQRTRTAFPRGRRPTPSRRL